jgi:hypothetical protein
MKQLLKTTFFLFTIFLVGLTTIFGDIIPNDEPMRLQGFIIFNGTSPNSTFEINGVVNNNQYVSVQADSTGNYSVTVAGNDGDNVSIMLCGIIVETLMFDGFNTNTININLTYQPDGVYGCTCDNVCDGGHCVNPGLTTGVCSSDEYYCDSDNICEPVYGETTLTCAIDCPRSRSSGSSSTKHIIDTIPIVLDIEIVKELSGALGIASEDILNYTLLKNKTSNITIDISKIKVDDLPGDIKSVVEDLVLNNKNITGRIITTAKSYKVQTSNGEKIITIITKTIILTSDLGDKVVIVEIIPKEIVSDASLIVSGDFYIIESDPIIAFALTDYEILNGTKTINYVIDGDHVDVVSDIITVITNNNITTQLDDVIVIDDLNNTFVPEKIIIPDDLNNTIVPEEVIVKKGSDNLMLKIIGYVLVVTIIAGMFIFLIIKLKHEDQDEGEHEHEEQNKNQ